VKVSGTVTIGAATITADLSAKASGLTITTIKGSWPLYGGSARAAVTFSLGTVTASGTTSAPEGVPY
jgi:hypothetical protein